MMKQAGTATHVAQAIELGNTKAKYDAEVKNILSDKTILAEYYTGYTLVTRGVFYGARMLSSQIDTEFTVPDYDSIKKVYSIWICMDVPEYAADTITEYRLVPDKLAGNYAEETKFDLLSVVMVCLGKDVIHEEIPTLHGLLAVILSHQLTVEEKKRILESTYGIAMTEKLEREMNFMCNLSDLIEERGIEKGIMQGTVDAEHSAAVHMLEDGVKPEKIVMYLSTLTLADVENLAETFGGQH